MSRARLLPLLLLSCVLRVRAADPAPIAPAEGLTPAGPGSEFVEGETPDYTQVIVGKLKGIVVVAEPDRVVKEGLVGVVGVENRGVVMPEEAAFKKRMSKWIGGPLTMENRTEILNDVVYHFRENGRPFVDVSVLPQDITDGVLQILVIQAKVGEVRVMGGKWFDEKALAGIVRARPGEALDAAAIARDLEWLNRNPFRSVDLVYVKGAEFGTANLLLRAVDRFPLRVYAGADDSGTRATQNERVNAGFNWGNAFGGDRQLDYQFLTSPDLRSFRAHSGSLTQPLPWRHLLTVFGSYADIRARLPPPFDLSGYNWQASVRYEVPLPSDATFKHSANAGFDYKQTNNNLTFGGVSVFASASAVAQFSGGWSGKLKDKLGETSARATVTFSPGKLTPKNDDVSFRATRADSRARYVYGKLELNRATRLPLGCELWNAATLQLADANLLPSEQLGFGGADSVRGYDTRSFNSDDGWLFSTEVRSPLWAGLSRKPEWSVLGDKWQVLGFVDAGAGSSHIKLAGERPVSSLLGVGPGVRWNFGPYASLRADYGWQLLNKSELNRPYASRAHFSAVVRY